LLILSPAFDSRTRAAAPAVHADVRPPRHTPGDTAATAPRFGRSHDQLGQDEFLARHGFGPARAYLLFLDEKRLDSVAKRLFSGRALSHMVSSGCEEI